MEHSSETKEFHLPLEMQFAMRKAEVHAKDLDRDELICALVAADAGTSRRDTGLPIFIGRASGLGRFSKHMRSPKEVV